MKSLFLRTTCSQRDRGLGEITRLLLGNPLYHSSFNYLNASLDIHSRELEDLSDVNFNENNDQTDEQNNQTETENQANKENNKQITKKSMLDLFAYRKKNQILINDLDNNKSFIQFFKNYSVYKNKLNKRNQEEKDKLVVITSPHVNYSTHDIKKKQKYCYYQYIKYADWDSETIKELTLENSIDKWHDFIINATYEIRREVE